MTGNSYCKKRAIDGCSDKGKGKSTPAATVTCTIVGGGASFEDNDFVSMVEEKLKVQMSSIGEHVGNKRGAIAHIHVFSSR